MNVKNVVVLQEVADDLNDGMVFYEASETGVGIYFWDSLIADIESLVVYAGIHIKKYGLYRMSAKRFPYAIYYEIYDDTAYVMAVLPMRRDPLWIEGKLKGRV